MNTNPSRIERLLSELDTQWVRWTLLVWLGTMAWLIHARWGAIHWLALGDTDDNMRLMQVRAWLNGQGWYDLRNYRLNPPEGFNIHWSRIVDLPIAAIIVILKPFVGQAWAERWAIGIAPLLPLSITMVAISLTLRRLVAPLAWPLGMLFLFGCIATLQMYMPARIDHHGWQLACLAVTLAGLADPNGRRGGAVVGLSSAVSLAIGLEMLPYCAMAGGLIGLRWVWDEAEAPRLSTYGLTLSGGCAVGYAAFASYDNAALRCDALTPVWLSVTVVGGALFVLLARLELPQRWQRLVGGVVAGGIIAGGFAFAFPQCLGRPEGVSPQLYDLWLSHVREARPIYLHPWRTIIPLATVPAIGLIGAIVATWRARGSERFYGWVAVMLFIAFAGSMLFWQVRTGPAAQLTAVIGGVALAWILVPLVRNSRFMLVRVLGTTGAVLLCSGLFVGPLIDRFNFDPPSKRSKMVRRASASCTTIPSMAPLNNLPAQVVFTHVDLGPRLITLTHHDAIAGPYHRNGQSIIDVHLAFSGTAEGFRAIAKKHHATLLLICPNMAETTIYRARSPGGFYAQIVTGHVPDWLEPVDLPENSPFRLWRIRYVDADKAPAAD